jgi:hypothetical protein
MQKRKLQQSLITSFLSKTASEKWVRIPQYFIFDAETFDAKFSEKFASTSPSCIEVGGSSGLPLMNLVLIKDCEEKVGGTHIMGTYNKSQISLLQSHLQKCIRKSNAELAVKTAIELMNSDFITLLRRLPIIMIEDCMVMQEIVPLIWLMMYFSSTSTMIGMDKIRQWICRLVYAMAKCPVVDVVGKEENDLPNRDVSQKIKDNAFRDVLWALKIRKFYGGTDGDMQMIQSALLLWYRVGTESDESKSFFEMKDSMPYMPCITAPIGLSLNSWDLSAVDFHCTNIHKILSKIIPEIKEDLWKQVLWVCASSITNKTNIGLTSINRSVDRSLFEIYEKYKKIIQKHQLQILKTTFTFVDEEDIHPRI